MQYSITNLMVNYKYTIEVHFLDFQKVNFYCKVNSFQALATPEELEEALTSWKKKIDDGTADQVRLTLLEKNQDKQL